MKSEARSRVHGIDSWVWPFLGGVYDEGSVILCIFTDTSAEHLALFLLCPSARASLAFTNLLSLSSNMDFPWVNGDMLESSLSPSGIVLY